jgi:hypothetical protein
VDAERFLRSLEGRELRTLTGAPNRIVGFDPGRVYVATDRSGPAGTSVPIAWVQDALDELEVSGQLEISVESVGYRSALIGAVLRELPGAQTASDPLRIVLREEGRTSVSAERSRRDRMWDHLLAEGGPEDTPRTSCGRSASMVALKASGSISDVRAPSDLMAQLSGYSTPDATTRTI